MSERALRGPFRFSSSFERKSPMTVFYGTQMTKIDSVAATPGVGFVHGNVRCFAETVTYATQTTSDTIEVGLLPKGAVFLFGLITTSVSTGSATLAIGITG